MSEVKMSSLFELESIEQGLFRGQSWDLGFRALFGGQVLGQALPAAYRTVEAGRSVHSFHTYFLLPGDAKKPVVYDVEVVRDGRSFSARRVKAIQDGRNIFYMTASFQIDEDGMTHQEAAKVMEMVHHMGPIISPKEESDLEEIIKITKPTLTNKEAAVMSMVIIEKRESKCHQLRQDQGL